MSIESNHQSVVDSPQTIRLLDYRQDEIELPPLPGDPSPLIGRERDLARLCSLFGQSDSRLITLTGGGGIGKTRLAIAAADQFATSPHNRAGFLSVSHLQDPEQLPGAISSYLKLQTCSADSLLDFLSITATFPLLLVFDNFEQIADGGVFLVDMLTTSPMITLLVTSRTPLRIRGEQEFRLGPLTVTWPTPPASDSEIEVLSPAVSLFVERAQEVSPNIRFNENRIACVTEICSVLDGFPLAIEIAAARCRLIPPEAMLPLLQSRLSFLTGGPRDAPKRHQTLRKAIQWTYDLLPPRTQQLFRFVSAFPGGFTFSAATKIASTLSPGLESEALSSWVLEEIEHLTDFSLLKEASQIDESSEESRFRLYETVRAFGQEKLAESGEIDLAHNILEDWSLEISRQARDAEYSAAKSYFDALEAEYPNIRASIEWLERHGEAVRGFQILHGLAWFMTERYLLSEAIKWTNAFLASDEITSDPVIHAEALHTSALIRYWCSNYAEAQQLHERALSLWRSIGDREKTATSLLNLANVLFDSGDPQQASLLLLESLEIWRETGNKHGQAHASTLLGRLALDRGDRESARQHYQTALSGFTEINQPTWISFVQEGLGFVALVEGDNETALSCYRPALSTAIDFRDNWRISSCLLGFAEIAHRAGRFELAVKLFAAAETSLQQMEIRIRKSSELLFAGWFSELREQMEPEAFISEWKAGKLIDRDAAATLALTMDSGQTLNTIPTAISNHGTSSRFEASTFGLTAREVEVLVLLSQGLGNREIASALSISHRTVMQHLSNIFPKLDVTSRTAAAAWAHHHNVV